MKSAYLSSIMSHFLGFNHGMVLMLIFKFVFHCVTEGSVSLFSLPILADSCKGHINTSLQDYGIICLTM